MAATVQPRAKASAAQIILQAFVWVWLVLALIPLTAFGLGTWQVQRLDWKTKLIAKFEDRLIRPPLPLPPRIDPEAIHEFDYRRVYATGKFRHDKEMLIGPRMRDGNDGFLVVTPLEREPDAKGRSTTVLVNRGWVAKRLRQQRDRARGIHRPWSTDTRVGWLRPGSSRSRARAPCLAPNTSR